MRLNAVRDREPWQERLYIPNYRIKDAARYASISPQTIANWHVRDQSQILSARQDRAALSYMQLIELAVVAAFRKAGVKLKDIKSAREYLQKQIESEHPFAVLKFKTDGKSLLTALKSIDPKHKRSTLIDVTRNGQLAWSEVLNRLKEFEYDKNNGIVSQWHVGGLNSPVIIDPRFSFGAPTVKGTPTWAIRDRWLAGESLDDISDDFELAKKFVASALKFEGIDPEKPRAWVN